MAARPARYIERVQAPDEMRPKMWSVLLQRSQRVPTQRVVLRQGARRAPVIS